MPCAERFDHDQAASPVFARQSVFVAGASRATRQAIPGLAAAGARVAFRDRQGDRIVAPLEPPCRHDRLVVPTHPDLATRRQSCVRP